MVDKIHYRWDFIGLSTDSKPTPEESPKVVDGSTFYESDTSKLYVFYKDTWYEKTATGGGGGASYTAGEGIDITNNEISVDTETIQPKLTAGTNITIDEDNVISAEGGGPTVVQTAGSSTTDVMSQYATSTMVFGDPSNQRKIRIGNGASSLSNSAIGIGTSSEGTMIRSIALGANSHSTANDAIAIGSATAAYRGSIAIGAGSSTSAQGEINVGSASTDYGYDNSNYRLLTGLYDGQSDHDAATVGQLKMGILTTSPTGTTAGMPGRLYSLDTGGGTYEVYLCVHDNGDNTYVWKQVSLI